MKIIMTTSPTGTSIAATRRARKLNKAVVARSKVRTASRPKLKMDIARGGCTLIGRPEGTKVRSPVFTITVTVVVVVPLRVTGLAVAAQLAAAGRPLQLKDIG
jgi:hypothetical protein